MPLTDIELEMKPVNLPNNVAEYLREADRRGCDFVSHLPSAFRGFVPSDYVCVYHALRAVAESDMASGNSFCEWGSGLGVVASLAALVGFDAVGIEIDRDLYDASRELAEEFDIPVELVNGSFISHGADDLVDQAFADCDGGLSLDPHADHAYDELGLEVRDFDVVFAYPWPNDEKLTARLFERFAARGALLLTYSDPSSMRLRRKVVKRSKRRGSKAPPARRLADESKPALRRRFSP